MIENFTFRIICHFRARARFCGILLLFASNIFALENPETEDEKRVTVYNTLSPDSISQHLAFYQLYPNSAEGKLALKQAINLLSAGKEKKGKKPPLLTKDLSLRIITSLITPDPLKEELEISPEDIKSIKAFGNRLTNRKLKGFSAKNEKEVLKLPPEEIDVVRAVLLSTEEKVEKYEAMIDLMALQILTKLDKDATAAEKIEAINNFIFFELRFRFPPTSLYAEKIDLYTFLPSVLDGRRGVCLGTSILYLAIAQRIDLPLEIVTPPGHIYLRYRDKNQTINIETTARGIHLPSEIYLGVNTCNLQTRNLKEVVGLAHFNQASTFWKKEDYEKAIKSYEIAKKYLPNDKLLQELLAYQYLFAGRKKEGVKLLKSLRNHLPDYAVTKDSIIEDYLNNRVDANGIKAVFMSVDETKESIIKKQKALEKVLKKHPEFREGYLHLAITWMQLKRSSEALDALIKYHHLDRENANVEYYLALLYYIRFDYKRAWQHLQNGTKITNKRNHSPKALEDLTLELSVYSPK